MPRFRYMATGPDSRTDTGERDAASADELRAALEADDLRVETIEEIETAAELTDADLIAAEGPPADGFPAGLPLESGLRALSEEIPSVRMKRALQDLSDRLSRGETLDQIAAADVPDAPPALRGVIQAGVAAGQPAVVLEAWTEYGQRAREISRMIWWRLAYSVALIVVAFAILLFVLVYIIPQFSAIFKDFGVDLPEVTAFLIWLSSLLAEDWPLLLGGLAAVTIGIVVAAWKMQPATRHRMFAAIPLVGAARRNSSLAMLCQILAVLVERRVPFPTALHAAGAGSGDAAIEDACRSLADDLEDNRPLATAAKERGVPPRLAHAFRWASRPETFAEALRGLAAVYEGQARARAHLVPRIVQPLVMFGVAACLLFIITGLFMPFIKLMSDLS